MQKHPIKLDADSAPVLDRVIEAYGFGSKMMLAEHIGIAPSSLSGRYKRSGFPADIVVICLADTGVSLEWLATGQGKKFSDDELDVMKFPRQKLIDGQLYESGFLMFDNALFLPGVPVPENPTCIIDGTAQFVIDKNYIEVFDGDWLIELEGKTSIRTLTRVPIKKVRVSGSGMAFDCNLDDVNVIGRVIITCRN